jgi:hypothetical protein
MKKISVLSTIILGVIILVLDGCQKNESNDHLGKLVIHLTDAPFPIQHIESANVIITKVEIRREDENDGYPFLTIMEDTLEFNLLDLRNGVTAKLVETDIPAGRYNLLRLYVHQASLKVKEIDDAYDVKVPSGSQTGIKIFIDPALEVRGNLTAELLLDINLENSFVLKGNMNTPAGIKGFNFKPVIRAVNNTTAGRIEGTVRDTAMAVLDTASVWIKQDTVIASTITDSVGFYALIGIPAGTYSIYATKENYDTVSFENVEILAGHQTIQDFTLTPKE